MPAIRDLNTDFTDYYVAARVYLAKHELPPQIYDWQWFQRQADQIGIGQVVTYTPNPPLCFAPVLPFAAFGLRTAKMLWTLANVGVLIATVFLLARLTQMSLRRVALICLLCMTPLRANFILGQMYVLLLFLIVAAAWCWMRQRYVAAATILTAGVAIKLYPLLFVAYFLRKKRWLAAATLAGGSLATFVLAGAATGTASLQAFLLQVLPRLMRGELANIFDLGNSSFAALFHRMFVYDATLNPHPLIASPTIYSILQPLCVAAIVSIGLFCTYDCGGDERWGWAIWTTLMLAISSVPMSYHYCLLIAAMALAWCCARSDADRKLLVWVLAGYLLASLPIPRPKSDSLWLAPLHQFRLVATLVVFAALALARREVFAGMARKLAFAGCVCAIAIPATIMNQHHLANPDPWPLVPIAPGMMNAQPAESRPGILYTSMTSSGYVVRSSANGSVVRTNSVHPTVSEAGHVWVEVLNHTSRIVRVNSDGSASEAVTEGESPVVSPDEHWLAFVRSGHLWLRSLADGIEREVALPGYEVLEISMSDTQMVFAAQRGREIDLFRMALGANESPQPWIVGERYPAISADDRRLAFSRFEGGSWHLWVRDLRNSHEVRMTHADCNAITPAWSARALYYASDCNRGLGLTELHSIPIAAIPQ